MFSSNNHTNNGNGVYPLAFYLSPFSNHDENISASYNHHHYNQQNLHPTDPLMAAPHHQFSSPTVPESLINYMAFSSNNVTMEQNLVNGGGCSDQIDISRGIKKPVKKDRHSKIHTAQGLRDRRVRLSIGIARQFFDLQDMLGFDKASKTLEWLLKKSRKAIREVVRAKKLNSCDFSSTNIEDECYGNNIGDGGEEEDDDDDDDDEDKSFVSGSSSDNCEDLVCETKKPEIGGSLHREKKKKNELSNSRANGRERAKERAKDITGSKNTDRTETVYEITHSQILDSLMSTSVDEGEEKLSATVRGHDMTHSIYKNTIQELNRFSGDYSANQDSVYIRRKIKPWTPLVSSYGQQNEGVILKGQSSSSNNITIMPQNWDIYDQNPLVDSPYCALSNMNMSTGLQ